MRIALLSCFYPYRGGISQFNACLFEELGKTHDVRAFNFSRQYPDFLFPGRTQKVTGDDEAVPVRSTSVLDTADPFSYPRTVRAIRKWKPDLLIVRYWMSWFAPSLGYVCRRMRRSCTVVGILDNVVPHEPHFFDAPLTKFFLSGCNGFITLCGEVSKDLLKLKKDARFEVMQHPLYSHFGKKMPREEAERRLNLEHGKKNLLFFGLIREYKGLDILLEAFAGLDESYQLIIAGEPYGDFGKYQKIIDRIPGGERRIAMALHYVRDSEVSLYFSAADLTVLPYRSATQSGISSVSYHFEVPMVVTAVGGLKETIGERGTGLVAAEVTPDAIRTEILRYFAEPALREKFVENIRREKERLSWSGFAGRLIEFAHSLKRSGI